MTDKMECGNCGTTIDVCGFYISRVHVCKHWKRNPHVWLDIPPVEPGWYWWKYRDAKFSPEIVWVHFVNGELWCFIVFEKEDRPLKTMSGEFQGPITPEG